jgi:hypothetical protein
LLPKCGNESSNGSIKEDPVVEGPCLKFKNSVSGEESKMPVAAEPANGNDQTKNLNSNIENSVIQIKEEVESFKDQTGQQFEGRSLNSVANLNDDLVSNALDEASKFSQVSAQETVVSFSHGPSSSSISKKGFGTSEMQNSASNQSKLVKKAREDAILKEARMIEVCVGGMSFVSVCFVISFYYISLTCLDNRQIGRELLCYHHLIFLWRKGEKAIGTSFWRKWNGWQMILCRFDYL